MDKSPAAKHHHIMAMIIALVAYTMWSATNTVIKLAAEEGVPTLEIIFINGCFCFSILFLWALKNGRFSDLAPAAKGWVFLRTLLAVFTAFCMFTAFSKLPLTNAYVVEFVSPMVVSLAAVMFLGEKLSVSKFLIILLGFGGTYVAINPTSIAWGSNAAVGYIAAAAGMLSFSAAQLVLRKISGTEKPVAILFAGSLGYIAFGGLASLWLFQVPSLKAVLFLFLSAVFGLSGWFSMLHALRRAPAATVSSLHYSLLVTGALFDYFIWRAVPEQNLFIGSAIIVLSGFAMAHQMRKSREIPSQ